MLNLRDTKLLEILKLADAEVSLEEFQRYLKSEDADGFLLCPDEVMAHFLDGLIYFRRGKDPSRPTLPMEFPVTNNTVLKKLRVAFELKETDIIEILSKAGFAVSAPELNAFFRRKDHSNYRECGDQYLRNFLKGLTQSLQGK